MASDVLLLCYSATLTIGQFILIYGWVEGIMDSGITPCFIIWREVVVLRGRNGTVTSLHRAFSVIRVISHFSILGIAPDSLELWTSKLMLVIMPSSLPAVLQQMLGQFSTRWV
ncbi:hypothetical protein BJ912DRAFT_1040102 [Pholiota molesta]|nr:hypothetical protein BJ912DRAFT_1040102 [Pholiota molesta]